MYHNMVYHGTYLQLQLSTQYKQRGFLLPIALFIIVALGSMSIMITKKVSQSTSTYILNGILTQTFYAAESGAQAGLHELFFKDTDRQLVDGRCGEMKISQVLTVDGLKNCSVMVNCECRYDNSNSCDNVKNTHYSGKFGSKRSFYTIKSRAQCGIQPIISEHLVEVGASL